MFWRALQTSGENQTIEERRAAVPNFPHLNSSGSFLPFLLLKLPVAMNSHVSKGLGPWSVPSFEGSRWWQWSPKLLANTACLNPWRWFGLGGWERGCAELNAELKSWDLFFTWATRCLPCDLCDLEKERENRLQAIIKARSSFSGHQAVVPWVTNHSVQGLFN